MERSIRDVNPPYSWCQKIIARPEVYYTGGMSAGTITSEETWKVEPAEAWANEQ